LSAEPYPEVRFRRLAPDRAECFLRLPPEYPGFQGHFPGEPVLPGMCHLALAVHAAGAAFERVMRLSTVLKARFSRKVVPGEELRILLTLEGDAGGPIRVRAMHWVAEEPAAEIHFEVE
jgi:3-hydroxymyristoyl/3-hydroxydecanoyl-(acyl carrier protein) dehydratase